MDSIRKKREILYFAALAYGRFLTISAEMIAMPTIITMMIATSPYMSVVLEAKPDMGVAVGAVVGADELACMNVDAEEP